MRSSNSAFNSLQDAGFSLRGIARRMGKRLAGVGIIAFVAFAIASLATWSVSDPSFSHATDGAVTNAMGFPGAAFADLVMQFFGLASVLMLVPAVFWGLIIAAQRPIDRHVSRFASWIGGGLLMAAAIGCVPAPATWPLPTGLGGVFGDMILSATGLFANGYPNGIIGGLLALVLTAPSIWLLLYASGLLYAPAPARGRKDAKTSRRRVVEEEEDDFDDEDLDEEPADRWAALGAVTHWWLSARAFVRRNSHRFDGLRERIKRPDDEDGVYDLPIANPDQRYEPAFAPETGAYVEPEVDVFEPTPRGIIPTAPMPREMPQPATAAAPARVENPAPRPKPGQRIVKDAQPALIASGEFEMPSLHFLAEPKNVAKDPSLSADALEQNARLLEGVLEDFGVKGEIIHVRPGPVVTLYELEPAPGIKSSRVIGLADDIARSMSAIACRVAVVPGRNAIGVELPNARRETVYLRELLASRDFEQSKAKLALALGKTINGEAVVADIAKMPHLLVAGTTGSGKSVAINTMILSLLYRLTPDQCRLIMIDPKMLELSVYDGIPHLLTPVVTDPKKAVVALKWTVREMEDRYRKMSKLGVRNIDGYNQRVTAADKKGEQLSRTVQTGFDRETGEAVYETESLHMEPMPYIVVIIDEMADLMMVAGKDIEGAVQRLAQMARAAGIHVIMATQRPSVDVITGTIKANFPTRISFQVTSKIDSRTILGEQGAEQLLGMGDMLYMLGGGRIQRVHGPFVADEEVEKVVAHLKMQGVPEYLDAITEDDDEDGDGDGGRSSSGGGGGSMEDSDDPYDQAVAIVLRDGKASTSYIQRRLGIGYNRAASIIEKMEKEGIVGPANHAGKREILVPTEEEVF
jgi:S-DNA-T family DNA segregation ATPase FtsK/SpoIIIE